MIKEAEIQYWKHCNVKSSEMLMELNTENIYVSNFNISPKGNYLKYQL